MCFKTFDCKRTVSNIFYISSLSFGDQILGKVSSLLFKSVFTNVDSKWVKIW